MKNKLMFFAILIFVFAANAVVGFAQSSGFELQYNADNQTVKIKGNAGAAYSGKEVTISLLQAGKSITSPGDVVRENVTEYIQYATQIKIAQDGGYETVLKINSEASGQYQLRILCPGHAAVLSGMIYYISPADMQSVLRQVNSIDRKATNALSEIENVILNSSLMVVLENTAFKDLQHAGVSLSTVYQNVLRTAQYTGFSQLTDSVLEPSLVLSFQKLTDSQLLKGYISRYPEFFGRDALIYQTYSAMSNQDKVINRIKGIERQNMSDLVYDFEENVLLEELLSADSWSGLRNLLLTYHTNYAKSYPFLSKLTMSEFKSLSDNSQYKVLEYILKNKDKIKDTDGFTTEFNRKVAEEKIIPPPKTSDGGKGSSAPSTGVGNVGMTNKPEEVKKEDIPAAVFTDLKEAAWAEESILELKKIGVLSGRTETTFEPSAGITREEFIKMIVAAFELTADGFTCSFTDADSGQWYYPYVAAAEKHQITYGDDEGNFGIGRGITREDMAVMLYRVLNSRDIAVTKTREMAEFTDKNNISAYAEEAVSALQQGGVINGMEDGSFAPKKGSTRAEAAKMIYGIMKMAGRI